MSVPSFSSIVEEIETKTTIYKASHRQRAYMIVLVFIKNIDDNVTNRIFDIFDRSDLTSQGASQILDLLVSKPALSSTAARARRATFGPAERDLKDKMSSVLGGQPWPEDVVIGARE